MRVVLVFTALMLVAELSLAADETLIPEEFTSGYFGGLEGSVTQIGDKVGLSVGARGGWIINHKFILGAMAQMLVNNTGFETSVPESAGLRDTTLNVMLMYGGAQLSYVNKPHKLFHYTASLMIGAGTISYKDYDCNLCGEESDLDSDIFFVMEPELAVVVNISPMVRLALGFSYRYVYDVELRGVRNDDLRSASGKLTIKVGRF